MGQQKGNPTPSYQNQAYETLRPNTGARANRDLGSTPVMLSSDTNLEEVLTGTEFTEVHEFTGSLRLANLPGGVNDEPLDIYPFISGYKMETAKSIHIIPNSEGNSITGYYFAVSGSTMIGSDYGHVHTVTGSVILNVGNYPNDTAAENAGVPINGVYHTNGTVKIRIV